MNAAMINCAVIGLGRLGCRIVVELASHGHQIRAYDANAWQRETLQRRIDEIGLQLERDGLLESGFKLHDNIIVCPDISTAVKDVEFVFEAVAEVLSIKKSLFKEITMHCGSQTVIGSNTLTIPLDAMAEDSLFTERVLGIRFLYPISAIPIVEYTTTSTTSTPALDKAKLFVESMGKSLMEREPGTEPKILSCDEIEYYQQEYIKRKIQAANRLATECRESMAGHGCTQPSTTVMSSTEHQHVSQSNQVDNTEQNGPKSEECVVCNENPIDALFFPCRHMWLCLACAQKLKTLQKPCPACRTPIDEVITVFRP